MHISIVLRNSKQPLCIILAAILARLKQKEAPRLPVSACRSVDNLHATFYNLSASLSSDWPGLWTPVSKYWEAEPLEGPVAAPVRAHGRPLSHGNDVSLCVGAMPVNPLSPSFSLKQSKTIETLIFMIIISNKAMFVHYKSIINKFHRVVFNSCSNTQCV